MDDIRPIGDDDLKYALLNNDVNGLKADDVEHMYAQVPGANDELEWWWVVRLKDGRIGIFNGWCDYTGWDCQSGLVFIPVNTLEEVPTLLPEVEAQSKRNIRTNIARQLQGTQPYGVYYAESTGR